MYKKIIKKIIYLVLIVLFFIPIVVLTPSTAPDIPKVHHYFNLFYFVLLFGNGIINSSDLSYSILYLLICILFLLPFVIPLISFILSLKNKNTKVFDYIIFILSILLAYYAEYGFVYIIASSILMGMYLQNKPLRLIGILIVLLSCIPAIYVQAGGFLLLSVFFLFVQSIRNKSTLIISILTFLLSFILGFIFLWKTQYLLPSLGMTIYMILEAVEKKRLTKKHQ